jgi:hypothetical protein
MEATVAALLLVTASVVLACVVVTYAVNIIQVTIDTHNLPEVNKLQDYVNNLVHEAEDPINGTSAQEPDPSFP